MHARLAQVGGSFLYRSPLELAKRVDYSERRKAGVLALPRVMSWRLKPFQGQPHDVLIHCSHPLRVLTHHIVGKK